MTSLIISIITIILIILSVLFFPGIYIKKYNLRIQTYWVISLIGALLLIILKEVEIYSLLNSFFHKVVGPIPILILFISMTLISIFLDEVGFFKYIALLSTKSKFNSQTRIFITLYIVTSILTIFTSNDIIILTFTPFICYFARNSKINPIPYLVSEFISANTWSMMFIIGNPTNIYISQSMGLTFFAYFIKMFIPTLIVGIISFLLLYIIFRKELKKEIKVVSKELPQINKFDLITSLSILIFTVIMLTISNYINIPMWIITFISFVTLFIIILIKYLIIKEKPKVIFNTLRRTPFAIIPFLLSMFTICYALSSNGVLVEIANIFNKYDNPYVYGISSLLLCNLVNNIPMSVIFTEILKLSTTSLNNIYIVIASSNIGAYLTPLGALAGIMWMGILKEQNVKFSFLDFVKYGIFICIPTILIMITLIIIL